MANPQTAKRVHSGWPEALRGALAVSLRAGAALFLVAGTLFPTTMADAASPSPSPTGASATISLSQAQGAVGTHVTAAGRGFPRDSTIAVYIDQPIPYVATPARLNTAGLRTDQNGAFQVSFAIPNESYGAHQICADTGYPGSSERYRVRACAPFSAQASLSIDPTSGFPGATVTVAGTGFPAGNLAALYIEGTSGYYGTPGPLVNALGAFQESITWPTAKDVSYDASAPGPHSICGDTGNFNPSGPKDVKACATFVVRAVAPTITVNPLSGQLLTTVTITGTGFPPSTRYGVWVDNLQVICERDGLPVVSDSSGAVSTQITLYSQMLSPCYPAQSMPLTLGRHNVCAQTGSFKACATFELLAAPTPAAAITGGPTPPWMIAGLVIGGLGIVAAGVLGLMLWIRRKPERRSVDTQG